MADNARGALLEAIHRFDRVAAVKTALRGLDDGSLSVPDLYDELAEILINTGAGWQQGTVEVWQEHLITGIVRTIVEACAERLEAEAPRDREATVVLAAPENEYHDLGLRMLADRFTLAGWQARFLGAAVPVREAIRAVGELGAAAIALSASTHFHRLSLNEYVAVLAQAHPDLRIWVGGPSFAREQAGWPPEMILDPRAVPTPGDL